MSAGHQALAARSGIQLRLVPSPRGVFVGVGVCGSMSVQQVSGVPWGWHRGAKMRFELEWGGSWDRASAERSAIAACQRRTRKGRDGRGRSRLRCHRHLFAAFFFSRRLEQGVTRVNGSRRGSFAGRVLRDRGSRGSARRVLNLRRGAGGGSRRSSRRAVDRAFRRSRRASRRLRLSGAERDSRRGG